MTTSIKPIPSYGEQYAHLYEQQGNVEDNHRMEIEEILLKVCSKDREIQYGRKVACFNSRYLSQDSQLGTVNDKTSVILKPSATLLQGISVAFQVGSAFFGGSGQGIGMALYGTSKGFDASVQHLGQIKDAQTSKHDFNHSRFRDNVGELSEKIRTTDKEHEQVAALIDRTIQNGRKQSDMFASA